MAIKKTKYKSINQALIILAGLVIAIGAVFIYIYVLRGVYGRLSADDFIPNSKLFKEAFNGKKGKVAILNSQYTKNLLNNNGDWLTENIKTWEKFITAIGFNYEIINDSTIELSKHYKYSLIIMPGAKSLSDKEIIQLKKYLDKGGSIFATGGTASYSDDGKWRGWDFFSEVFGIRFTKEISNDEATKVHTIRSGLPITANVPTGFPLKVATWDRPMAVEVLDPRTTQVSFWYNYRLEEGLIRNEIKKSAGIVYGKYGHGRFIWMGFEINSILGAHDDYLYFDRLFQNSIHWLTYTPIAYVRDWPRGYNAAAVITPVLSNEVENIKALLEILREERIKSTFLVDPYSAEKYSDIIKQLKNYGEVAALVNFDLSNLKNDSLDKVDNVKIKTEKLIRSKKRLEYALRNKVVGALPLDGVNNESDIKAFINAGFKYVLSDSLSDRSIPKTIIRGDQRIFSMSKTSKDDYEVIRDLGLTDLNFQRYTYQEDIDKVLFESGMYIYKFHSDIQAKPEYINVVKDVIDDLKKKNFWIATFEEIQKWYEKRSYVELRVEKRGDRRVAFTISNPGKDTINDLVVEVDMIVDAKNISLSSELIGTKLAKYKYNKETKILYVYIDGLTESESRTYYIDYDKPNT